MISHLDTPVTHYFPPILCISARRARQDKTRIRAIEACIARSQWQDGFVTAGAISMIMDTNADPARFPCLNAVKFFLFYDFLEILVFVSRKIFTDHHINT